MAVCPKKTCESTSNSDDGRMVELQDYLRAVWRRWKVIASVVLAALAIAAVVTLQMTPQYSSSARLFVSASQQDSSPNAAYEGGLFSAARVASYADLSSGQELARRVIGALGLNMEPDELTKKIDAKVIPDTVLLQISVTDPDPKRAQMLTRAVANQFRGLVADLETPPGKANAPIKATIVDQASLLDTPESPNPLRNLVLAGILGLLLGLGAAVVRELLDNSVKGPDDVAGTIGTAVMGSIPFDHAGVKKPLVDALGSHAPRVEAFRILRTNLQFVDVDRSTKVFVVTSSVAEEGKTTTACNLAVTIAQAGQRVLLVEADLRRPKLSEYMKLETAVGLTMVLVGRLPLDDAIQDYSVENLSVLTSGAIPPNPSELLQSQAMSEAVARMRRLYDVVIVDAPPLLPVTDAALLTAHSDGALVVVRHGKTSKEQLRHSKDRLDAVGGRAIGVVLNMVPTGGDGYGTGYSRRGYGKAPEPVFEHQQSAQPVPAAHGRSLNGA